MMGSSTLIGRLMRAGADVLWPPACPVTGERVSAAGRLSPAAWSQLTFLAPPWCDHCGRPFGDPQPEGALCTACVEGLGAAPKSRAAIAYDDASRDLILAFKHADKEEGASAFADWMRRAGAEVIATADMVVPVPLHWRRLLKRRRNQAADLARAVARSAGLPYRPGALIRGRATPSQGGLSAAGRLRNVAGAFRAAKSQAHTLVDARILLIDDVFTTGATLAACAKALRRAGARDVAALTLARRL